MNDIAADGNIGTRSVRVTLSSSEEFCDGGEALY